MSTPVAESAARDYRTLRVRRDNAVLHVQLDNGAGNLLTQECVAELISVLDAVRRQPDVRVIVLSGASGSGDFCLGGDRAEFVTSLHADPTATALRDSVDQARVLCGLLEDTSAVTIARLQGRVVGAGLALAVYCDLRVASTSCRLRLPELALGMAPAWGGALGRLVGQVGHARIAELLLTAREIDAWTAERIALVHQVRRDGDLDNQIDTWTSRLRRWSPQALSATKLMLRSHAFTDHLVYGSGFDAFVLAGLAAGPQQQRAERHDE